MNALHNVVSEKYGVNAYTCDPLTVLWATSEIEDAKLADKYLDEINKVREKWGKIPVYIPYGHRLF